MTDNFQKYLQQIEEKYKKLAELEGKSVSEVLNMLEEINEASVLRLMDNEQTPKEERLFWVQAEIAGAAEVQIAKLMLS